MKRFIYSINTRTKLFDIAARTRKVLLDKRGEGFVDTALKILIAVVIGALLLAGLYALFGDVILPQLSSRITQMFNYQG